MQKDLSKVVPIQVLTQPNAAYNFGDQTRTGAFSMAVGVWTLYTTHSQRAMVEKGVILEHNICGTLVLVFQPQLQTGLFSCKYKAEHTRKKESINQSFKGIESPMLEVDYPCAYALYIE